MRRLIASICVILTLIVNLSVPSIAAPTVEGSPVRILPPLNGQLDKNVQLQGAVELPEYILGPGDILAIADPSLSNEQGQPFISQVQVAPDGTVTIYPVGVIKAAGLTVQGLTAIANDKAKQFIKKPNIVITLLQPRIAEFHVLGDVVNPGIYSTRSPIPSEGVSARSAPAGPGAGAAGGMSPGPSAIPFPTVLVALQLAGGLRETADFRHIRLTRAVTKETFDIDLWKVLVEGDGEQDVVLRPGDMIYIPKGKAADFSAEALGMAVRQRMPVRVWGAVKVPGLYYLEPGDDLFSIIARAGGFTDFAAKGSVLLSRRLPDGRIRTKRIRLGRALRGRDAIGRMQVLPGDVVIASESALIKHGPRVTGRLGVLASAVFLLILSRKIPFAVSKGGTSPTPTQPTF